MNITRTVKNPFLKRIRHNMLKSDMPFKICANIFLIVLGFVFIYPFLFMITTSFKSFNDLFNLSVNWIPREPTFKNFTTAFSILDYPKHFFVSLWTTVLSVTLHILIDSFIAYGLARYKFRGRGILTFFMVLSILVPTQVILLPQYVQFSSIGWLNSYLPMIIPLLFGQGLRSGLFIFIFRQFFVNLPKSLEEAAMIDGCGFLKAFFKVVFPTARTSMLVCGVMAAVWHWNDYMAPSIYLKTSEKWPLPSMLPSLYTQYSNAFLSNGSNGIIDLSNAVNEASVAAGIFMVALPLLITYAFVQKKFVEGVERSGITGE